MTRQAWRGLGWALGIALLAWVCWKFPWADGFQALSRARPAWLAGAAGVAALSITLRSLRLQMLLPPSAPFLPTWGAVVHTYLAALGLPMGGSEVLKTALVSRRHGIPLTQAAAAVVADRLCDVASLLLLLFTATWALLWRVMGIRAALLAALFIAVLVVIVWLFRAGPESGAARWLSERRGLPAFVKAALAQLFEMLGVWKSGGLWKEVLILQAAVILSDVVSTSLALHALVFSPSPPLGAALPVAVFIQLAFAMPLLPGSLGTHQAACVLALGAYGVSSTEALVFSILVQVSHVIMIFCLNGIALALPKVAQAGRNIDA